MTASTMKALIPCFLLLVATGTAQAQGTWGPSATMGVQGGTGTDTVTCPSGKYAIGLATYSGNYVNGIRLVCAVLGPNGEHQSVAVVGFLGGSHTGSLFIQRTCPGGKVMVGFQGRAGWWIDRVGIACKYWRASEGGTTGSVSFAVPVGGDGGSSYGPLICPGQRAVYQVNGWDGSHPLYGWLAYGYRFYCKEAS